MNWRMAVFLLVSFWMPLEAKAEGRFCVVNNFGQSNCMYNDIAACQQAANATGGICSPNQAQAPAQPRAMHDPWRASDEGFREGEEDARRLRAAREENFSQAARANNSPAPEALPDQSDQSGDWVTLLKNDVGDEFFVDRQSIRKSGDTLQVWTLVNLATPNRQNARSQKAALYIRCQSFESAFKSGVSYSALNGQGQIVGSLTATQQEVRFERASPESVYAAVIQFSCEQ
jgi:hypothetical protein